jgi:hypothetical protein
VIRGEKQLSPHLPDTRLLSEKILWSLLGIHKEVIIKPCLGYGGHGVLKVTSKEGELYEIHAENAVITFHGKKQTYDYLKKRIRRKQRCIVQQRIPLATIDDCPFDLRVMVQRRKGSSKWEVTGTLAKVAAKNFVITNVAREISPVEKAIELSSIDECVLEDLLSKIDHIALLTAKRLQKFYPKQRMIGIDMGIDQNGNVWIIETNFKPGMFLFHFLEDKTMYHTMKGLH